MLYSIQFLRFVAAFGVVMHHTLSPTWWTKIDVFAAGMDVFFVISGFVISYSTRDDESVIEFAAKRIVRVFPIYWIATAVFIGFQYAYWGAVPGIEQLIRSVFLIPKLGVHWQPIYFLAWTLVYECAFYGLFALLLSTSRKKCRLLCMLILTSLAAITIPVPWNGGTLMSDMLIEFVYGLLIAELMPVIRNWSKATGIVLLGAALMLFIINYDPRMAPIRPISWGLPAALLVAGIITFEQLRFFQLKSVQLLGNSSYSIYLFHMTVIQWVTEVIKRHEGIDTSKTHIGSLVLLFVATGSGVLIGILIEKPLLSFLRRKIVYPIRYRTT